MTTKQFGLATLAGGVTLFVLGYLIYGIALADFFTSNSGSATGVGRVEPVYWALGLGQLVFGAILALVINKWVQASSTIGALKAGATIGGSAGFLMALAFDLTIYGTTNISNVLVTVVDPFLALVQMGVAGAIIGVIVHSR